MLASQSHMNNHMSQCHEVHHNHHSHDEINNCLGIISGEIIDSYEATSRQKYRSGLHLLVKTDQNTFDVHLGSIWYLEQKNFSFEPGDAIVIRGSAPRESLRDQFLDSQMLTMTAIEVIKDNKILTLREEDGFPMWRASLR